MRFLIDAHLPSRFCTLLAKRGHDCTHTLHLPARNKTTDSVINQLSVDEERIVISKDTDFFYSHMLQRRPWKLLLVKTGNISAGDLYDLIERNISEIEASLQIHSLVEIDRVSIRPVV